MVYLLDTWRCHRQERKCEAPDRSVAKDPGAFFVFRENKKFNIVCRS